MRTILINNYDLLGILKQLETENHNAPTQHLWGYLSLPNHQIDAEILPYEGNRLLKKLGDRLKVFGDLDQQLRFLSQQHQYDVVYSAQYLTTSFLSLLSVLGLFKKPIVAIGYQAPRQNSFLWRLFTQVFAKGNRKILCLSESMANDLEELGVPRHQLDVIQWGADLRFYQPATETPQQATVRKRIFSPGKTHRDYSTLIQAFAALECELTICGAGQFDQRLGEMAASMPSVTVIPEMLDWRAFIQLYQDAYAVAIPLDDQKSTFKNAIGLTVLTEAMAMGKPIIMTRNDYVGVDLEKENIGIWVEPGDVQGWQSAIERLIQNPEMAQEMGRRARLLAEKKFNLEQFSKKLAEHLWEVCEQPFTSLPDLTVRESSTVR